jgi:phenylpropionate dioxygenase-like ring-hydroxylating dioxygenase large terminal subunit
VFLMNCWYVAAWSHEVDDAGTFARTIIDVPVVLWRDSAHQVVAFVYRCCHRGAPLSRGRKEGDSLRCMYHGLLFDRGGRCIDIPSQDTVPAQAFVRAFPVVERHRWIWIWMGDPARADPALIPDTHWLDDPGWRGLPGYMHYDVGYRLITDNLLDFSHLAYVHATTLGGGGSDAYARVRPTVERQPRGVKVTRWLLDDAPAPFVTKLKRYPGNVDRWNIYDYLVPGILLMDSGSAPTGTGAPEGVRLDAAEFRSCQALTPETAGSTHYFFQQMHNFALDQPEVTRALYDVIVAAFHEDQAMITAQAHALAQDPGFQFMPIVADSALAQYARMLEKMIEEERAAATNDAVGRAR